MATANVAAYHHVGVLNHLCNLMCADDGAVDGVWSVFGFAASQRHEREQKNLPHCLLNALGARLAHANPNIYSPGSPGRNRRAFTGSGTGYAARFFLCSAE